ncbi:hypothetical protein [Aeromicrobium sp. HA]|uniref:hypothetical protein n=1 Tax=Aeromicrobium sp. HA TaxID=3009077 RepID=UPI0022AFA73D|nr:hypothetical protein [Aeromicrobium sp. HA]
MPQNTGQRRATNAVAAAMRERDWTKADLAATTGLDYGTISDMLDFSRTIQSKTQARIEEALGWEKGTYRLIALGELDAPAPVTNSDDVDTDDSRESASDQSPAWLEEKIAASVEAVDRATAELEVAKTTLEGWLKHKAIRIATSRAFEIEAERRAEALGRPLSELERFAIDSMERLPRSEVLEIENEVRAQYGLPARAESTPDDLAARRSNRYLEAATTEVDAAVREHGRDQPGPNQSEKHGGSVSGFDPDED